jgi:arylsulfatase A-like enzyme
LRGFQHNEVKGEHFARRYKDWITGKSLTAQITEVLQRVKDKPTFLWAHYLDSHDPFDAGGKERNKFRRYLNSLRTVDQNVGKLRHAVEELGLSERALFVVFSDHGEAFGEHGATFHGTTLYDELLRVPLLIYGPTVVTQQRQELVSLIDLGPTVLDWFALPTPSHFMGESLGPLTRGKKTKFQRPVAAETRLKRTMLFTDGTKVIEDLRAHTVEVYDLEKDRGELRNLSDDEGDPRLARIDEMRQFFAVHAFTKAGYELPYVK